MTDKKVSFAERWSRARKWTSKLYHYGFLLRGVSIRTRLLVYFICLVLVPAGVISVTSAVLGWKNGQQQVTERLELAAKYRESEIGIWVDSLETDLNTALTANDAVGYARRLLLYLASGGDITSNLADSYMSDAERRLALHTSERHQFSDLLVLDLDGRVVAATDITLRGRSYADVSCFLQGMTDLCIQLTPELNQQAQAVVAIPIGDTGTALRETGTAQSTVLGVLIGYADTTILNELLLDRTGLGNTGETYLVGADYRALTKPRSAQLGVEVITEGVIMAINTKSKGSDVYANYHDVNVVGVYTWLPSLHAVLVAEQEQRDAFRTIYATVALSGGLALLSALLAVGAALWVTRDIADPLSRLADTAKRITSGNLDTHVHFEVERIDEVGVLSQAFAQMTERLRDVIGTLEHRIVERTSDLEHRTEQLTSAAQVSRQVASVRNIEQLLTVTVHRISEEFGFYHAGLFLVDDNRQYAVLRAASSEGGQQMLSVGHKLKIGAGIVGYVAETNEARIALDVGIDSHFFDNPYLPETRSEMGLPLAVRGEEVIGVLDVQSTEPNAFSSADVAILQTMADQVALAIDNARLFASAEQRLREVTRLLQSQAREGWEQLVRQHPNWGYFYDGLEVRSLPERVQSIPNPDLVLPVHVREQPIGQFSAALPDTTVSNPDVDLARAIIEQAGRALENAQMFNEAQITLQEVSVLYNASQKISGARTLQAVLDVFVEYLVDPGIDCCVLAFIDENVIGRRLISIDAAWESDDEYPSVLGTHWDAEQIPIFATLLDKVLVLPNVAQSDQIDNVSRHTFLNVLHIQAMLVVPLMARERLLGWLLVESLSDPYLFSEREVRLYRGLAAQAALAIQNIRLLEEANRHVEHERQISAMADLFYRSVDMDMLLRQAVQELSKLPGVAEVAVHIDVPAPESTMSYSDALKSGEDI
ncbi:MAG: GAF domain-containing protein [Anaerolineae bacterium]|nr:GAF domain-containing protein [Anaerolineae bacterium]